MKERVYYFNHLNVIKTRTHFNIIRLIIIVYILQFCNRGNSVYLLDDLSRNSVFEMCRPIIKYHNKIKSDGNRN